MPSHCHAAHTLSSAALARLWFATHLSAHAWHVLSLRACLSARARRVAWSRPAEPAVAAMAPRHTTTSTAALAVIVLASLAVCDGAFYLPGVSPTPFAANAPVRGARARVTCLCVLRASGVDRFRRSKRAACTPSVAATDLALGAGTSCAGVVVRTCVCVHGWTRRGGVAPAPLRCVVRQAAR